MNEKFFTLRFWLRLLGLVIVTTYILPDNAGFLNYVLLTIGLMLMCEGSAWMAMRDAGVREWKRWGDR